MFKYKKPSEFLFYRPPAQVNEDLPDRILSKLRFMPQYEWYNELNAFAHPPDLKDSADLEKWLTNDHSIGPHILKRPSDIVWIPLLYYGSIYADDLGTKRIELPGRVDLHKEDKNYVKLDKDKEYVKKVFRLLCDPDRHYFIVRKASSVYARYKSSTTTTSAPYSYTETKQRFEDSEEKTEQITVPGESVGPIESVMESPDVILSRVVKTTSVYPATTEYHTAGYYRITRSARTVVVTTTSEIVGSPELCVNVTTSDGIVASKLLLQGHPVSEWLPRWKLSYRVHACNGHSTSRAHSPMFDDEHSELAVIDSLPVTYSDYDNRFMTIGGSITGLPIGATGSSASDTFSGTTPSTGESSWTTRVTTTAYSISHGVLSAELKMRQRFVG